MHQSSSLFCTISNMSFIIRFFCGSKLHIVNTAFIDSRPNHFKKIFNEITDFIKLDQINKTKSIKRIYESENLLTKISDVRESPFHTDYICTQLNFETGTGIIST